MWYVIQTITGKEKELVEMIHKVIDKKGYDACFVIQHECVWRIEGKYRVHVEPLFPSYVFVETETPEELFYGLVRVPRLSKLLGIDGAFWAVQDDEEKLLRQMMGEDKAYIIRRSLVEINKEGKIISADGPLNKYIDRIVRKKLRKRNVTVEIPFLGENRRIQLGIYLAEDRCWK